MRTLLLSSVSRLGPVEIKLTFHSCAIKRFQKTGKCYACGQSTNGIFNKAEKIIAKIEKRNQERRRAREEEEVKKYGDDAIVFGGGASADEADADEQAEEDDQS
jgi:RING finger protein 113A